ncbi:hypothetical protein AB0M35_11170 [Micromonospora sp. NPDC051196]
MQFTLLFSAEVASYREIALDVTQFGPDTNGSRSADLGGVRYLISAGQR